MDENTGVLTILEIFCVSVCIVLAIGRYGVYAYGMANDTLANNDTQTRSETMKFTVKFISGAIQTSETLDDAKSSVYRLYPEAEIGHDGDLSDGGNRTLCWLALIHI